jgi:signal transduction histidine kinase/ligand-binding sensor domain-containing protein
MKGLVVAFVHLLAGLAFAVPAAPAPAASAGSRLAEAVLPALHHTAWTRNQGAPANIYAIAQDADGWLWLGTQDGLYRFDGVRFEHVDGASEGVMALMGTASGDLWVGTRDGRILRRRHDGTQVYDGFGNDVPMDFARDRDGTVLAAFNHGLQAFVDSRWQRVALPAPKDRERDLSALTVDAQGAAWLQDGPQILVRRAGQPSFVPVAETFPRRSFAVLPGGGVLVSEFEGRPFVVRAGDAVRRRVGQDGQLTGVVGLDRQGRLWVSGFPEGLEVYDKAKVDGFVAAGAALGVPERMSVAQGLSGKHPWAIFQDREGNVWVGTNAGLDRFRSTKLTAVPLPEAGQAAVSPGDGGGVWIGRWNMPWARTDGAGVSFLSEGTDKPFGRMNCACRGRNGDVWLCGNRSFLHLSGARTEPVPYPPQMGPEPMDVGGAYVQSMAVGTDGDLWVVASPDYRLLRLHRGAWTPQAWPAALPRAANTVIETLADGHLCAARGRRVACRSPDGTWEERSPAQGLDIGVVESMQAYGQRLWLGGTDGLAWMDEHGVHAIGTRGQRGMMRNISGVVETRDGDLWFNAAEGVGRISKAHLDRLLSGAAVAEPVDERFDHDDGLDGTPEQVRPAPTAIASADGRLWFATSVGVYWIDPAHIRRNAVPPAIEVQCLGVDEQSCAPQAGLEVAPDPRKISIAYTGLSLSVPERVRFEYRLEGFDTRWTDAGTRREAVYTKLPAGRYEFQVRAVNEDGVYSPVAGTLAFRVQPALSETWWFRGACVLLALLLVAAAVRWRFVQSAKRLRERLEARLLERERIARELHDTLLQAVTGLVLKLDGAIKRIPAGDGERRPLEAALEEAERAMVEGRDRVMELRRAAERGVRPEQALSDLGRRLEREGANRVRFEVHVAGEVKPLQPMAGEEALWIGREALVNAFRHAQASRVTVAIAYEPEQFVLRVQDDGRGIGTDIAAAGQRVGHWGLPGMRERAALVGGRLDVGPAQGGGTAIELVVRGARIYAGVGRVRGRWFPIKRLQRERREDVTAPP